MAMNVLGLFGWIATWWGSLYVLVVFLSPSSAFIFVFPLLYSLHRAIIQLRYFRSAFDMLRILRAYPWQVLRDVPHGLAKRPEVTGKHYGWFEFRNPARTDEKLPLVFSQHIRVEWWARRMAPRAKSQLKAQIQVVWFAGDPRFVGLIAAPTGKGTAPRRLHVVEQRTGRHNDQRFADWGATAEDIERGRRAGVFPAHL